MYRVLLVDDEAVIRQGLQKLLPWEEYGLEVAGIASDGLMALEMIERDGYDIMLLDITMPHMSGLELLEAVRQRGIGIHTIIISAYNTFQYVREALKFGVENYLIKPVEKEELASTLSALVHKIDQEHMLDMLHRLGQDTLMDNVVYRYATGRITESELAQHSRLLQWDFARGWTAVTLIKLYAGQGTPLPYAKVEALKRHLAQLPHGGADVYPCLTPEGAVLLMMGSDVPMDMERWRGALEAWLPRLAAEEVQYFAVVSSQTDDPKTAAACYRECNRLLAYEFILPRNQVISSDGMQQASGGVAVDIAHDYASLKKSLLAGNREAFEGELRDRFEQLKQARYLTPWQIRGIVGQLLLFLFQDVDFTREGDVQGGNALYDLMEMPTMDGICERMVDLADRLIFSQQKKRNTSRLIAASMISYVQDHYSEEISLKILSQALHFHAAYLGQVFKAETGQVFSDYLCSFRMEKAKELLREPSLKISEIAIRIGIPNANYFSNTFKKLVGTYPSTYRMILQDE